MTEWTDVAIAAITAGQSIVLAVVAVWAKQALLSVRRLHHRLRRHDAGEDSRAGDDLPPA